MKKKLHRILALLLAAVLCCSLLIWQIQEVSLTIYNIIFAYKISLYQIGEGRFSLFRQVIKPRAQRKFPIIMD